MGSLGHKSAYKAFRRLISLPADTLQKTTSSDYKLTRGARVHRFFFCRLDTFYRLCLRIPLCMIVFDSLGVEFNALYGVLSSGVDKELLSIDSDILK